MNKSVKRARYSSPQSNQQAELPTAYAAEELLSSDSPSPEQPDVCDCEAELPLQPDIEQELPSSGDTESGKLAAVKEEECEVDVPGGEQGSLVDANEEEESSSDEESAGQEPAGVNTIAEEASTSEEDSGEEGEAAQQPGRASHNERSAANASRQADGASKNDQQAMAPDSVENLPVSWPDEELETQPVTNGKLSNMH